MKYKQYITIERKVSYVLTGGVFGLPAHTQVVPYKSDANHSVDSLGSDWSFDDGTDVTENDSGLMTIYSSYPCKIIEKVQSYETSKQGENYTGRCVMKGMLTDKLKKGDLVDGSYKIVGKPRIVQNRETVCNLVRIH